MSRALTTAAANAAAAGVVRPVLLIDLEFSDGTVRYTTADRDVTYNSNSYDAAGHFASISQVMEGTELEANRILVGLNGAIGKPEPCHWPDISKPSGNGVPRFSRRQLCARCRPICRL